MSVSNSLSELASSPPLIAVAFSLGSMALVWLVGKASKLIDAKLASEIARQKSLEAQAKNADEARLHADAGRVLAVIAHLSDTVTADLESTIKSSLETMPDGRLTPEARAKIEAMALDNLKQLASGELLSDVHDVIGIGSDMLDAFLRSHIRASAGKLPPSPAVSPVTLAPAPRSISIVPPVTPKE